LDLVSNYIGYRLPMDHSTLQDSAYNEWYKAAAYSPDAPDTTRTTPSGQVAEPFHWIYGFGRDVVVGADANYLNSGDPFDNAVTPVGIYNLQDYPADYFFLGSPAFSTNRNDNYFGVDDMAGNAWEWIQGHGSDADRRAYRGGAWNSPTVSVENISITDDRPDATFDWIGLRVVQSDPGLDPLVDPDEEVITEFTGPPGGPFVPDATVLTITSRSPDPLDWEVSSDVAWLDLDGAATANGTLQPFESVAVTGSLNEVADTLPIDLHAAVVSFIRDSVEFTQRSIELDITGPVDVDPLTGLSSSGPAGGPFFPDTVVYTLTNTSETDQLFWQAVPSQTWVLIDGGPMATGALAPLSGTDITVSLSTPGINELAINEIHDAYVVIEDLTTGASTNRSVAVSVGLAPLTIEMATVPADDPQPYGPQHTYRIGAYEITNGEFLAFLNDAYLNMDNARGSWMFHDTDSGDVYIHSQATGAAGTDGAGLLMFDAFDGGHSTAPNIGSNPRPRMSRSSGRAGMERSSSAIGLPFARAWMKPSGSTTRGRTRRIGTRSASTHPRTGPRVISTKPNEPI
jgi:formylglycine-generating enzyme required for sulfatase activity